MRCVLTLRATCNGWCGRSAYAAEALQQVMSTFTPLYQELRWLPFKCAQKSLNYLQG